MEDITPSTLRKIIAEIDTMPCKEMLGFCKSIKSDLLLSIETTVLDYDWNVFFHMWAGMIKDDPTLNMENSSYEPVVTKMEHRVQYVRGMRKNLFDETEDLPHWSVLLFARRQYTDICAETFINGVSVISRLESSEAELLKSSTSQCHSKIIGVLRELLAFLERGQNKCLVDHSFELYKADADEVINKLVFPDEPTDLIKLRWDEDENIIEHALKNEEVVRVMCNSIMNITKTLELWYQLIKKLRGALKRNVTA